MRVHVPTPLRTYTDGDADVEVDGATLDELLTNLDARHPGIRFRMVDEQNRLREHMKIFVNQRQVRDLHTPLAGADEIMIMQALSGG